ncbi:MAG: VWA domain-containing protein [Planctomycetia bacterium]|nr:VWA domain-containing protein [Planctomycetia bacterium]MBL6914184.1 VWA domain-containing protein [Planctomycetota bacterium]HCW44411.1 hypothetical protein [Planctomycetota bacterium]
MIRAAFLIGASFLLMAADTPLRRPLDMPSGGSGAKEDSEDFPETIEFFGGEYEGDAFMFVIDVSGSMGGYEKMETAQEELNQALMSLSSDAEFGIVAFSNNLYQFNIAMVKATPPHKVAGSAWVMGLEPAGGTCIDVGTIQGLNILGTTLVPTANRRLILLGDGAQGCGNFGPEANEEALANIMAANWEQVSIDTLFIGEPYDDALWLFENIAQHNFGEFRMVN